jgi:hypothetical protein
MEIIAQANNPSGLQVSGEMARIYLLKAVNILFAPGHQLLYKHPYPCEVLFFN